MGSASKPWICGVPWFRPADYEDAVEVMDDRRQLPAKYETWQQTAEQELERLRQADASVFKAYIWPPSFLVWCLENNQSPDEKGRRAYANYLALQVSEIDWSARPNTSAPLDPADDLPAPGPRGRTVTARSQGAGRRE